MAARFSENTARSSIEPASPRLNKYFPTSSAVNPCFDLLAPVKKTASKGEHEKFKKEQQAIADKTGSGAWPCSYDDVPGSQTVQVLLLYLRHRLLIENLTNDELDIFYKLAEDILEIHGLEDINEKKVFVCVQHLSKLALTLNDTYSSTAKMNSEQIADHLTKLMDERLTAVEFSWMELVKMYKLIAHAVTESVKFSNPTRIFKILEWFRDYIVDVGIGSQCMNIEDSITHLCGWDGFLTFRVQEMTDPSNIGRE